MAQKPKLIKKTLIIHPAMDDYVRKTWAMLIDMGCNATYSSALNFMLLAMIIETIKEGGLSDETKRMIWDFARDPATMTRLNEFLKKHLAKLREYYLIVLPDKGG